MTVSGEKFIDIVIDHLDERDFLLDYAKKLEKAYLKTNPKRTQNLIVQEILLRQDIISNIENYLCLVRSAETLVNDSKKSIVDICTNTLAYAMATEKEKELLIKVFQKIEENIQQYSVEKLSRYSNAMSGILYLQIAECALKIEISFTQEIRNSRSVNLVRMTLGYNVHQIFQKIKY